MQPNYTPQIATSDGGVIATSQSGRSYSFDQTGTPKIQIASMAQNPTQANGGQWPGWLGNLLGGSYSVASGSSTFLASGAIGRQTGLARAACQKACATQPSHIRTARRG